MRQDDMRAGFCILAAMLALFGACPSARGGEPVPGQDAAGLEVFDAEVQRVLQTWDIPGASLAVAKNGKLVLAKGYGWADRNTLRPVSAQTLFRMGSINKTLTAVAVLQLTEDQKLALDQPVLPLLKQLGLVPRRLGDARAASITVRHLLQHSAGMDREKSGDPFFQPMLWDVARRQGVAAVGCDAIITDTLERPLDFAPGERFAYSNTGYCMLGKVVEAVSGEPIARRISRTVLQPAIGKDFAAGKSMDSLPNETRYYPFAGQAFERAAPGLGTSAAVASPYGSYVLESMDALGSWVATPTDVLRFFLAIDGTRGERLLAPDSVRAMQAKPDLHGVPPGQRNFYGLGVVVTATAQGLNWWHDGSQPGVQTLAVRTAQGYAWVIAFNSRPKDKRAFFADFDKALWRAARAVQHWPEQDLL